MTTSILWHRAYHATQGQLSQVLQHIKYSTSEDTSSCNLINLQTLLYQVPCHSNWPPFCHMTFDHLSPQLVTLTHVLSKQQQCYRCNAWDAQSSKCISSPCELPRTQTYVTLHQPPVHHVVLQPVSLCWPLRLRTCCRSRSRVAGVIPGMR